MRAAANLLWISLVAASLGCHAWDFSATASQKFAASPPTGLLVIEGSNGAIEVRGADVDQVSIEAVKKAYGASQEEADVNLDKVIVNLDESTGDLRVVIEKPRNVNASVSFTVVAPHSTALQLKTSNGALAVSDIKSPLRLETSNGRISVKGAESEVRADTSNGAIEIHSVTPVTVVASTSNGAISFEGGLAGADNKLETSNGRIKLGVWGPQTTVDARTSNGAITVDGESKGKSASAVIGQGDLMEAEINVRTKNGSIEIRTIPVATPAV